MTHPTTVPSLTADEDEDPNFRRFLQEGLKVDLLPAAVESATTTAASKGESFWLGLQRLRQGLCGTPSSSERLPSLKSKLSQAGPPRDLHRIDGDPEGQPDGERFPLPLEDSDSDTERKEAAARHLDALAVRVQQAMEEVDAQERRRRARQSTDQQRSQPVCDSMRPARRAYSEDICASSRLPAVGRIRRDRRRSARDAGSCGGNRTLLSALEAEEDLPAGEEASRIKHDGVAPDGLPSAASRVVIAKGRRMKTVGFTRGNRIGRTSRHSACGDEPLKLPAIQQGDGGRPRFVGGGGGRSGFSAAEVDSPPPDDLPPAAVHHSRLPSWQRRMREGVLRSKRRSVVTAFVAGRASILRCAATLSVVVDDA